jgi:hypothetical protein
VLRAAAFRNLVRGRRPAVLLQHHRPRGRISSPLLDGRRFDGRFRWRRAGARGGRCFWLVSQRITLFGGKRYVLQLRLQRIALTYRIQLRLQRIELTYRKIGILLGLLRSYLRLGSRNSLACLRRCRNGYCRDKKTGSHQGSD